MGSSKSFDMVKKYFDTSKFTFAFVNLRGYGASKDIEGSFSSCEASGDVINLAKHLGWSEFHIVGHSMGGMISQKVLLKASKMSDFKVLSYVGVSPVTANGFPADTETQGFLKAAIHNPELSEQLVSGLTRGRLLASWNKAVTEEYIASSNASAMLGYFGMWVGEDFSAEIQEANIQTPLLVISGKQDLSRFQY
jgi:pimeloyl-ACP methyl ester carboxylesterase